MGNQDCYAFDVWVAQAPDFRATINHRTANKAKYEFLIGLQDYWPEYNYTDLRARKVGSPHTSHAFEHNAKYRGVPDIKCGQRVEVGQGRGVIISHNSAANFDVLFDEDSPQWAGQKLSVHPAEIKFI